jgi:hypothetical protein
LSNFVRIWQGSANSSENQTINLHPYILNPDGTRAYLYKDPGTIANDPPNPKFPGRPKTVLTYGAAMASNPNPGSVAMQFYPTMSLNAVDNRRFALGGFEVFVGVDPLTNPASKKLPLEVKQVTNVAGDYPGLSTSGFRALQYGAVNNTNALLAGIGDFSFLGSRGILMFSPNVETTLARTIAGSPSYGYQAALFDKQLGTNRIYASNSVDITRGTLDGGGTSYTFTAAGDLSGTNSIQRVIALQTYPAWLLTKCGLRDVL